MTRTLFLLAYILILSGQSVVGQNTYLVYLKDKANSPYSINKPEKFLSPKALERRQKYNIPIVENDLPINPAYVKELSELRLKIHHQSRWLNAVGVICKSKRLEEIHALPFVENVFPIKTKGKKNSEEAVIWKKDFDFNKYNDHTIYGLTQTQTELIRIQELHKLGYTGKGMHIAILDAGFYKVNKLEAFEKVRAENRIIDKFDFVGNDNEVYNEGYHGMRVMSTIAGEIDYKFIGSAPHASFYLYRTEDGSSESKLEELNWIAAAERADSIGVDLINSSLGYNDFDDDFMNYTHDDLDGETPISSKAAAIAASKGILVVVSAGNSGDETWQKITPPADARNIITVGATVSTGEIAAFSSVGPSADGRIKPDITAMGVNVSLQAPKGGFDYSNGTSYAAPTVCGSIACLWQAFPELTNLDIIKAVQLSGENYFNPTYSTGYGLADFYAGYSFLEKMSNLVDGELMLYPKVLEQQSLVFYTKNNKVVPIGTEVIDNQGKALSKPQFYDNESDQASIDNPDLQPGVYQLKVHENSNVHRGYFVVLP